MIVVREEIQEDIAYLRQIFALGFFFSFFFLNIQVIGLKLEGSFLSFLGGIGCAEKTRNQERENLRSRSIHNSKKPNPLSKCVAGFLSLSYIPIQHLEATTTTPNPWLIYHDPNPRLDFSIPHTSIVGLSLSHSFFVENVAGCFEMLVL